MHIMEVLKKIQKVWKENRSRSTMKSATFKIELFMTIAHSYQLLESL